MQLANLVSEDVKNRLVNERYLHSNTENFVKIANGLRLDSYKIGQEKYERDLLRLQRLIEKANNAANAMYEDIGIQARDVCIFKKTTMNYISAGAQEFQRRYLADEVYNVKKDFNFKELKTQQDFLNEKRKRFLAIFNSLPSLEYLRIANEKAIQKEIKAFKLNKQNKTLIEQLDKIGLQRTLDLNEKVTIQELNNYIDSFFTTAAGAKGKTRFANSKGKAMRKEELQNQALQDLMKIANATSTNSKVEVEKVRSYLKTQLISQRIYKTIARNYWDGFFARTYQEKVVVPLSSKYTQEQLSWLQLTSGNRKDFIDLFCSTLEKYPQIAFTVENPVLRGFTLEFGQQFSSDIVGDKGLFTIIGQDYEQKILKEYKGKNQPATERTITAMSASDMIVRGQKRQYRLQLKNNLHEDSNFLSFRIQSDIALSNFLETAYENDTETKEQLEYLLLNICYLRQYGRGPWRGGATTSKLFKWNENQKIRRYVQILLSTAYAYILSATFLEQIDNIDYQYTGNIAFIFKGKYLIPVTAFLVSAYSLLLQLVYYRSNFNNSSVGGLMSPTLKSSETAIENRIKVPSTGISPETFQAYKQVILRRSAAAGYDSNIKRYPKNLVEYSSNKAESFYRDIKMRLNIGLSIDSLERILK